MAHQLHDEKNDEVLKAAPSNIAIAVSTCYFRWYKGNLQSIKHTDKVRGDLCLKTLHTARRLGYQVVVVDAKSNNSFRKELSLIPGLKVIKRRLTKRSPSRRLAFKVASSLQNIEVIVYTDPEKVSLVSHFIPHVVNPILQAKADIVIPNRNIELFKSSYPAYQFGSETEGNSLYNEQLRVHSLLSPHQADIDIFFGPRAFRNDPKILSLFMKRFTSHMGKHPEFEFLFDPEDFSNAQFFPIVLALKKKLRVLTVEVPFVYPVMQKENEEIGSTELFVQKRRAQRLSILMELMHLINYLERKHSRLRPKN